MRRAFTRQSVSGSRPIGPVVVVALLCCSLLLNTALLFRGVLFKSHGSPASAASSRPRAAAAVQQWPSEHHSTVLCADTCARAKNGVCDEGRGHNLTQSGSGVNWVFCDLGTDCYDCGPWHGLSHGPSWRQREEAASGGKLLGPIAYLQSLGIEVRVRATPHEPRFLFAFTDPGRDTDESHHMADRGMIEPVLSQVAVHVLQRQCDAEMPGQGHVVDVGANFGWFSILAASLGCRVTAFEPVPIFQAFFEYSACRSRLRSRITLHPAVVSNDTERLYTLTVPTAGQWGATKIGMRQTPGAEKSVQVTARAVSLAAVLPPDAVVSLLKVDVEGFEPVVMAEAAPLIRAGLVHHMLFEYAPAYYTPRMNERGPGVVDALPRMMLDLHDAGYSIAHLPWGLVFAADHMKSRGWAAPLPGMERITRRHSEYDLWSMQHARDGSLPGARGPQSWPCEAMRAAGIAPKPDFLGAKWAHWHPKGLHASFIFNTNCWAALDAKSQPLRGNVGAAAWPPERNASREWFPAVPVVGTTYSDGCDDPKTAVAARCRCPDKAVCGQQQAAVEACGKAGLLGYVDYG